MKFKMKFKRFKLLLLALSVIFLISFIFYGFFKGVALIWNLLF